MVAQTSSVYIVAHQDDWQLFMEPNVGDDLVRNGHKKVIIHLTAGDGGLSSDFWLAREEGVLSSIRYRVGAYGEIGGRQETREIRGHKIHCWTAAGGSIKCFFLRLPDGGGEGDGFPLNQNQSLLKLLNGTISTIDAVDASASYDSWGDLIETIESIVIEETQGIETSIIHHPEWEDARTPADHSDHRTTGQAIVDSKLPGLFVRWTYVGYNIGSDPADLTDVEIFWKAGMFAAYEKSVYDLSSNHHRTLAETPAYFHWCLRRSRYRVLPIGQTPI